MFVLKCIVISVLGICLTYCFRVTVSAVLSLVVSADKLFYHLLHVNMFEQRDFDFEAAQTVDFVQCAW